MTSDRLGETRGSKATAFEGTSSPRDCRTLDSVGTPRGRVSLRGLSRCSTDRRLISNRATLLRIRSRLRATASALVRSSGIRAQPPDRCLVPSLV